MYIEEGKILLVDDDQPILEMLQFMLTKEKFANIYTAETAKEALKLAKEVRPDLIVLDIMLPDGDGLTVCKDIRQFTEAPILFLTAKNSYLDKLAGFSFGGDDYITKPFNPLEVVARIRVQLKRHLKSVELPAKGNICYDFGYFQVDETAGQLYIEGKEVHCPAKELQLLLFLCQNPQRVFSFRQIYQQVWKDIYDLWGENTIKVHVHRLREKIEPNPIKPIYLLTVRGLGYKLVAPKGDNGL
jgi:DNA-binding response OmpR family regulator